MRCNMISEIQTEKPISSLRTRRRSPIRLQIRPVANHQLALLDSVDPDRTLEALERDFPEVLESEALPDAELANHV